MDELLDSVVLDREILLAQAEDVASLFVEHQGWHGDQIGASANVLCTRRQAHRYA
jgi:hypothetical protein